LIALALDQTFVVCCWFALSVSESGGPFEATVIALSRRLSITEKLELNKVVGACFFSFLPKVLSINHISFSNKKKQTRKHLLVTFV
jgi:hypothetical protein